MIMDSLEIENSKGFIIAEMLEYIPNSVVIKTILRKITGNITALAFDSGEVLTDKTSRFDNLLQVIEGKAEVIIDEKLHCLTKGDSIIIPAHSHSAIKANERFKMISTIIKSGYE
jgi:quercetin dioxygenase-like cupin family protein